MEAIPFPGDIPLPDQEDDHPPGEVPLSHDNSGEVALSRDNSSTEKDVHVLFQPPNQRDAIIPPPPNVSLHAIKIFNCMRKFHIYTEQ